MEPYSVRSVAVGQGQRDGHTKLRDEHHCNTLRSSGPLYGHDKYGPFQYPEP